MISADLVQHLGVSYSRKFGIDLEEDPFPWFLLSVLFGARISESVALRTFQMFRIGGLLSPEAILEAGWDGLVGVLDSGGYTRYDFRTATKLLEMSRNIIAAGSLRDLHDQAGSFDELVSSLKNLAKGIGDVTVGIFMREMVGVWPRARPYPTPIAVQAARMLRIDPGEYCERIGVPYGLMESFLVNVGRKCLRTGCRKCIFPDLCREYLHMENGNKAT